VSSLPFTLTTGGRGVESMTPENSYHYFQIGFGKFISVPADTAFYGPELNISEYNNIIKFLRYTTGLKLKVQF
jgi:hypothetical protein